MKKSLSLLLCGLLLLSLTACSANDIIDKIGGESENDESLADDYEANAVRIEADTTYYNDYLGVSFKLPTGWYVYEAVADNFATSEGITSDGGTLDIYMEEGYKQIYLGDFANLQDSRKSNHMNFELYAEQIEGITTLSDFVEDHEIYQNEAYGLVLTGEDSVLIGGQLFEIRSFEYDGDVHFYYLNFICEVSEGYFLVIETSYWPENTDAPDYITNYLTENLTAAVPSRPAI